MDKGWKGQEWQFKQTRIFKTLKRTCQNSNLNPLWQLLAARPTWSLHCVTALELRDRSDRLQCSTPTWPSITWWAFTPASVLIYCRLVYLHMWISPVWKLKFSCFTKQRSLFQSPDHHHFPLLQPWLRENYSYLFLWKKFLYPLGIFKFTSVCYVRLPRISISCSIGLKLLGLLCVWIHSHLLPFNALWTKALTLR